MLNLQNAARKSDTSLQDGESFASLTDVGTMLRERREAMGVTMEEVESATKIRQKYLSALEADDWHLLPGEIVGRGFLRNYAAYLELEPNEIIERRRAVTDPQLRNILQSTSAGSVMPPSRSVDYRPKDVSLIDDDEALEDTGGNGGRILTGLLIVALLGLVWWNFDSLSAGVSSAFDGIREGFTTVSESNPTATAQLADVPLAPTFTPEGAVGISSDNDGGDEGSNPNAGSSDGGATQNDGTTGDVDDAQDSSPPQVEPTATPTEPPQQPTNTPLPPPPPDTPTPVPPPPTPEPVPTLTPTPEPPQVVAPQCPDARSVISSPGVNQVVSGVVEVLGTATHENFQFYKVEIAVGANADGGFNYLGGASNPVSNGRLWSFDSSAFPNGGYTLQVTSVDQTANFPPPCRVSITIQN